MTHHLYFSLIEFMAQTGKDQQSKAPSAPNPSLLPGQWPDPYRGPHDMGGLAAGPVDTGDHALEEWERRCWAINGLLRDPARGAAIGRANEALTGLDESRRHAEELGDRYRALAYGERAMHALARMLINRGVLTAEEITARMEAHR